MLFLEKIRTLSDYQEYMSQTQVEKYQQLKKLAKNKPNTQSNITTQLQQFRKNIESQYKIQVTDYQAFLWKSKLTQMTDYPQAFKFIKIIKQVNKPTFNEQIPKLDFSPLAYTTKQLVQMATKMILENQFSQQYLSYQIVHQLITKIASQYNIVSYHNFSHGFNLTHILFQCFKADKQLKSLYSSQQITFALISGITHDINHNGTNNSYQVKMNTQLAKIAQNDAVLQKMHVRTFFNILKKNKHIDVLNKSTCPQKMKKFITRIILSTDISKHFKNLQKLKKSIKSKDINFNQQEDKYLLMQNLFHACDIGNPCLSYNQYINWASLLTYQFNQQSKLENKNQLQVTKLFVFKGNLDFYKEQVGFINAIVYPLWKELSVHWPGLNIMIKNLDNNLKQIQDQIDQQKF